MKKFLSFCGAALTALFLCPKMTLAVAGGQLIYDNYMPVPNPAAYSSTFSIRADGIDWAAAQVVVTSVTIPAATFTDGQAATTSLTVVSYLSMSTQTATNSINVASNTGLAGACISGGGPNLGAFNVCNPGQWAVGNVSSNTACNIAAAIQAASVIVSTCGTSNGTVIYDSAPSPGAAYNNFQVNVSTAGALALTPLVSSSVYSTTAASNTGVGFGTLTGGQNALTFMLGGQTFTAFGSTPTLAFSPVTSTAQTATNIAAAINGALTSVVAGAGGSVVYATATVVGPSSVAVFTSSQGILNLEPFTSSGPLSAQGTLAGGATSSYLINTSTINFTGGIFGTGVEVWISTTNNVIPGPLVYGTTYYEITNAALGTGNIELATTQANAVANVPIVLTSSTTKAAQDQFTLNPESISGTPLVQWVASNDNVDWVPFLTTPFAVTLPVAQYGTYIATGTVTNYDFGHYDYSYLGLSVTAPTAGAIKVQAHIVGNAP